MMRGTPGGMASFTITGITSNMAMNEHEPGVYTGSYVVGPNDMRTNALVVAMLQKGEETVKQEASTALNSMRSLLRSLASFLPLIA